LNLPLIPHSRPVFDAPFEQAAKQTGHSQMLAQGEETTALEADISAALNIPFVLAIDSGTHALMLALRHLTAGKQQPRVAMSSYACASLLFAVKHIGGIPLFIDCDAFLCMNKDHAFAQAAMADVLILVHPFGMIEPLAAETFPCPVIEDIAQSVGGSLADKAAGSFGDMTIGSLYATKPWGGAYGGFIASRDEHIIAKIRNMTDPDRADISQAYAGHHQLSNMHATLARQRLLVAKYELGKRQEITKAFAALVENTSATWISSQAGTTGNHFRFIVRCINSAEDCIAAFQALGIGASKPVIQPLHHSGKTLCRQTDLQWQHNVSLPVLTNFSAQEFERMSQGILSCL